MSEKRYFKIFSERHTIKGKNNYVVLFDVLDGLKSEDDQKIRKQLAKRGQNDKFLSADKNYLFQLILKCLNDYHCGKTFNLELKELLLSIEVLFQKGLYAECLKLVAKAEELALECENYALMIDVCMWKKKCAGYSSGLEAASQINQAIEKYLRLLNHLKQITNLYYKSYAVLIQADGVFTAQHKEQMRAIVQHNMFNQEVDTFTGRVYYYLIKANYHLAFGQFTKEKQVLEELLQMIDYSKTYGLENPLDYVSIYNRMLNIQKKGDADTFFATIQRLRNFGDKAHIRKELIQERIYIHCITHELEHYLLHSDYKRALNRLKVIDEELPRQTFNIEIYHLIYYHYLRAIAFIFSGQFSKALKSINHALNEYQLEDRVSVYIRIMMLNVVVHFELGNYNLVEKVAKLLFKENDKYGTLSEIESTICVALVEICNRENITKGVILQKFKPVLELIQKQKTPEHRFTLMQNIEHWIKMKM